MRKYKKVLGGIFLSITSLIPVMGWAHQGVTTEVAPYFNIENPPPSGPALGLWPTTGLVDAYIKAGLSNAMITLGDIGQGDCPDISVVQDAPLNDIKEFLAIGGDLIFSIGGGTCGSTPGRNLVDALTEVIQKTGIQQIDFDVEDESVTNQADTDRRNQAILELKKRFPTLFVSFTLGATPGVDWNTDPTQAGLATGEYNLVKNTLASGAKIDRITLMPFGWGFDPTIYQTYSPGELNAMTVESVADQMEVLFSTDPQNPIPRKKIYSMLGDLPDIGLGSGDVGGAFHPSDALFVGDYARKKGLSLISYYVFQRDQSQDKIGDINDDDYLNRFSGVPQKNYQFFHCFEGKRNCEDSNSIKPAPPAK